MITQERTAKRPYGAYSKQVTVDVTSEQFDFMSGVRDRSGRSLSDVVRLALDLWRHQIDQAG